MSLSKTAPMAFSMAHLSSLFMAPGRGNFLRFLAVLILMERGARPKAETSSLPPEGRPSQEARSQLFLQPLAESEFMTPELQHWRSLFFWSS